jgi:hypothetical protein
MRNSISFRLQVTSPTLKPATRNSEIALAAFVAFIKTYAVWIYLVCGLGIVVGIKLLTDARHLARTTLFSLEQERAVEQTFRSIIFIFVLLAIILGVTGVNFFVAPAVPISESPILRGTTPTLSPLIFPTGTRTFTPSPTGIPFTETPFMTNTPALPTLTRTPTRVTLPASSSVASVSTAVYGLPAPTLKEPINNLVVSGESNKNTALTFKWTWDCAQCVLGPDDRFLITISFINKDTGRIMMSSAGVTQVPAFITMGSLMNCAGFEIYSQAKDSLYTWNVQVKRGDQPVSPPSETFKFTWK